MSEDLFDDDLLEEDLLQAAEDAIAQQRSQEAEAEAEAANSHQSRRQTKRNVNEDLCDLFDDDLEPEPSDLASIRPTRRGPPDVRPGQSALLRQTTLFGGTVNEFRERVPPPLRGPYRTESAGEPPTHHKLDNEALKTWVYPMNLGPIREYQYSIVKSCLFNNTLVALPTGLGKTFIAAAAMLNFYRWTKKAQIIFTTPTKPLAAQQVDACLNIAGIPRSDATLLTGEVAPGTRAEEWATKRVFFTTPQTLNNDLSAGFADPKNIVLLVVDEAHRATGEYAYVKVVKTIRRFSDSFRVLALTATPGSKLDAIQNVIDNLGISHIEIRTEESMDIRKYVHSRDIEQQVLDPSDELVEVCRLFSKALKPVTDKLSQLNVYWGNDAMALTQYGLHQKARQWNEGPGRQAPQGQKFMARAVFSLLATVAHPIKLLNFHGIKPFYDNLATFRSETEAKGEKGSKYRWNLITDKNFQEMMHTIDKWLKNPDFISHPKLTVLADTVLNHFMDNSTQTSSTKIIVFSEYRDSAEDIVHVLNRHQPMIRAKLFVGQADSKRSAGMKQADQIQTIERFRKGEFNVLVATSIGEEGLDIGQVDLIVCYDASGSPIRMLQRMGRTGRKRAGKIVLLLMRGKEQEKYEEAKAKYSDMQKIICAGGELEYRYDQSRRIVPRGVVPEVDKKIVEIPVENTQNKSLPLPRKTRAKRPPKKFHMPDGVVTGFVKASDVGADGAVKRGGAKKAPKPTEIDDVADVPPLDSVVLSPAEIKELRRVYQLVYGNQPQDVPFSPQKHYYLQRSLRPTMHVKHGEYTKRVVRLHDNLLGQEEADYPPAQCPAYQHLPVPDMVDFSDGEPEKASSSRKRRRDMPSEEDDVQYSSNESRPKKQQRKGQRPAKSKKRSFGRVLEAEGDECRSDEVIPGHDSDDGEDLRDFVVSDDSGSSQPQKSTSPTSRATSSSVTPLHKNKRSDPLASSIGNALDLDSDDDDDFPSLSQIVGSKKKPPSHPKHQTWLVDSDSDDSMSAVGDKDAGASLTQRSARGGRRVLDSDSDEELTE